MTDNVFAPPRSNVEVRTGPDALWAMTFKQVRRLYHASSSIRALGVLYGLGSLAVVAAIVLPALDARGLGGGDALPLVAFLALMGGLSLAAAVSSFTRPRWGRWLGIALCIINLVNIPFGTLIGILGLVAYIQGAGLFGPGRFLHKELVDVYNQRKHDKQ
jgi:hypothetical protein